MKRQLFREQLATHLNEAIVYVDEAGMDNREDYGYGTELKRRKVSCPQVRTQTGAGKYDSGTMSAAITGSLYSRRLLQSKCIRDLVRKLLNSCAETWTGRSHG